MRHDVRTAQLQRRQFSNTARGSPWRRALRTRSLSEARLVASLTGFICWIAPVDVAVLTRAYHRACGGRQLSDEPPIDDDILSLIEHFRGRSAAPARDPVERRTERRVADRRGLGLTARRRDDAERNRQRRTFLLSYLRRLPAETLWAWIDGVWLGCATDAQLDELMQAISESGMQAPAQESRTGRPRTEQFIPGEHPLVETTGMR
jgi:hypothetical protein